MLEHDTTEADTTVEETKYWCFISYRHADNHEQDRQWAQWLHREIEQYEVPAELIGCRNDFGEVIPERIYPVFRDETSLAASANLGASIEEALRAARFLIVLCSPRAVESAYVNDEIRVFKLLKKQDRIMAALIAGEPGDPEAECFPPALRHPLDAEGNADTSQHEEPVAADFRLPGGEEGYTSSEALRRVLLEQSGASSERLAAEQAADRYALRLQAMKLKIIAGILGVELETLLDRDKAHQLVLQRRRARILRTWLAIVSGLAIAVAGVAVYAYFQSVRASKQELAALRSTLASQLELAARDWRDGETARSLATFVLSGETARAIAANDYAEESDAASAERQARRELLWRHARLTLEEPEGVRDLAWTLDGQHIVTLSEQGRLRLWNARSGETVVEAAKRLPSGARVRTMTGGSAVYIVGINAVQEAAPLFIWRWSIKTNVIEEVFLRGESEVDESSTKVSHFEISPDARHVAIGLGAAGVLFLTTGNDGKYRIVEPSTPLNTVTAIAFDGKGAWTTLLSSFGVAMRIDATSGVAERVSSGLTRNEPMAWYGLSSNGRLLKLRNDYVEYGDARKLALDWPKTMEGGFRWSSEFAHFATTGGLVFGSDGATSWRRMHLFRDSDGSHLGTLLRPVPAPSLELLNEPIPESHPPPLKPSPVSPELASARSFGVEILRPLVAEKVQTPIVARIGDPGDDLIVYREGQDDLTVPLGTLRAEPNESDYFLDVTGAALLPDGEHLLAAMGDLSLVLLDLRTMRQVDRKAHSVDLGTLTAAAELALRTQGDLRLVVSPDGLFAATWVMLGATARLWRIDAGELEEIGAIENRDAIRDVTFSKAGNQLYLRTDSGLEVYALQNAVGSQRPSPLRTIPAPGFGRLKPLDSGAIAILEEGRPVWVADPETGATLAAYFLRPGMVDAGDWPTMSTVR